MVLKSNVSGHDAGGTPGDRARILLLRTRGDRSPGADGMHDILSEHPASGRLAAYALGVLGPAESAEVARHVTQCASCRILLKSQSPAPRGGLWGTDVPPTSLTGANPADSCTPSGEGCRTQSTTMPPGEASPSQAADTSYELQTSDAVPPELADHPRYEVLQLLGSGGMGVVYKARHRLMDRLVALKLIHPMLVDRPDMVERFRREVRAAARLAHPNIVVAYDAERRGDTHFLVMEFVQGTDLEQLVSAQGQLPIAKACDYARQTALGLQHAFERHMVHRDIKPHNLMVTPEGQVKILDFGLAHFVSETKPAALVGEPAPGQAAGAVTGLGAAMGTADYMAPEEARDAHCSDIRADIYSLGCTLYCFLAGQVPFPGGNWHDKLEAHAHATHTPLSRLRADLPDGLARVIDGMMRKEPAERHQTPIDVASVLTPFAAAVSHVVLIVDDNLATRDAMCRTLERQVCVVSVAESGKQALQSLRAGLRPELILLGVATPGTQGWQFLRALRYDSELAAIPTVLVTVADRAEAEQLVHRAAQAICRRQSQQPV
jgi:CheY-like chemotaxis protein